ncbi:hypothetical protein [Microbulbifer aggregans]|uniref:hypothetical protein n=1 Tax=Microbulbifer aggregans TaxID=1769779 RepID=UPI001CFD7513|nr:hypothetical protein [Microbulbifer aggregans]
MKLYWPLLIALLATSASAEQPASSTDSLQKMKTLVGDWNKEGSDGETFYISFQLSANGSVLVENWVYKGASHSMTMYHLDGGNLLATHYCPQGNQPRLKLKSSNKTNTLSFEFLDATNLESLQASHQNSLEFEFVDINTISRTESYIKSDKITPSKIRLVRRQM